MRLVVLSPEDTRAEEAALVEAMVEAGLTRYHVRKPQWSAAQVGAWLHTLSPRARARCVLHGAGNHVWVERAVTLGRHWSDAPETAVDPGSGFTSRACHDVKTLEKAWGRYTAVLVSPVFPSLSKEGRQPGEEMGVLPSVLRARSERARQTEAIALGGVTRERVAECAALGFDGVAVLGAVWLAPDPWAAFGELLTITRRTHAP